MISMIEIKCHDIMTMFLNDDLDVNKIECTLPILGEGNNRIVYDMGNGRVLKVAKSAEGSFYNHDEIKISKWQRDKKNLKVKVNNIFEYDENHYWYIAEFIKTGGDAMEKALKLIPCLDYSDNAGYDMNGILTVVDAEMFKPADFEYVNFG